MEHICGFDDAEQRVSINKDSINSDSQEMNNMPIFNLHIFISQQELILMLRYRRKYTAHNENNGCKVGDRVFIQEHKPISATRKWIVVQVG
ncbi:ribosomal protein S17 [Onchocerca flexuosa]|uniref:Small ribosomal subunit protein uS17 n=1 Tax=Onchocerca flexuosa TaxID=387005 RepID=A0A238BVA1_9BILA|nr:ribosomal protein S17 [Onchocerca flexuosa]